MIGKQKTEVQLSRNISLRDETNKFLRKIQLPEISYTTQRCLEATAVLISMLRLRNAHAAATPFPESDGSSSHG
ncbi:protein of unknown function [Pseudomonas sp. JV241A]|nr:protein of unknown function [Pseudomonas sp. JV241A]